MVKKRTPTRRKSSAKSSAKRSAKPARKAAKSRSRAAAKSGVDFNPVKRQLRAHIAKLERQLGGAEARAAAVDQRGFETLDQLRALNLQLSNLCQPTMVIPNT